MYEIGIGQQSDFMKNGMLDAMKKKPIKSLPTVYSISGASISYLVLDFLFTLETVTTQCKPGDQATVLT